MSRKLKRFYLKMSRNIVSGLYFHHFLELFGVSVDEVEERELVHVLCPLVGEFNYVHVALQQSRLAQPLPAHFVVQTLRRLKRHLNVTTVQSKGKPGFLKHTIWPYISDISLKVQGRPTITASNFMNVRCYRVFLARFFVIFRVLGVITGYWRAQIRVN